MLTRIMSALVLTVIAIRTAAFASYQAGRGNKPGAVGLLILGLLALAVPMVLIWLRVSGP